MVVNAAPFTGSLGAGGVVLAALGAVGNVLAALKAGGTALAVMGAGGIAGGTLVAATLGDGDFTVGFSFGFRAAFAALRYIFMFSISTFNGRRRGPPSLSRKQTSFRTTAAGGSSGPR
jgi:hypothetical protein